MKHSFRHSSNPDCNRCRYYVYSTCLGSPDVPIFHCSHGFVPFHGLLNSFIPPMPYDCRDMADDNEKFILSLN